MTLTDSIGTEGKVGTEGMGVMGGDTHIQCCEGAEGRGVIGGDTHRQCWDGRK